MGSLNTIKRGDSRFYVDSETGAKAPGVTSVVGMLPKGFLQFWAAKMVAESAVENMGAVVGLAMNDKAGAIDYLKNAPRRFTAQAGETGSAAHDIFERMARGQGMGRVHPDLQRYANHFGEFLDEIQPEFLFLEDAVWSDTHNYAGSFDAIAKIGEETVIIDWKTTRSGVHEEVALQLAAYANADRIVLGETGESVALPRIDAAAVLHVRPEAWKLVPVKHSPEMFQTFLHLRALFDWERELKKGVIGHPVASGGELVTGTQRRACW
ncbi:hypothetical protein E0L36_26695 [Streptomyces sp. AJS327]|uniref:hypothetical protein n=1 Tax=Streptomyces sp. AJS327 TaxID=2545265 RepID=UPI0015E03767|nr:hypothetical protein [Streptomyces sp. AJS327]MBA0054309.1 hypothetical protein [Streptomyces sp. AJS327]